MKAPKKLATLLNKYFLCVYGTRICIRSPRSSLNVPTVVSSGVFPVGVIDDPAQALHSLDIVDVGGVTH